MVTLDRQDPQAELDPKETEASVDLTAIEVRLGPPAPWVDVVSQEPKAKTDNREILELQDRKDIWDLLEWLVCLACVDLLDQLVRRVSVAL